MLKILNNMRIPISEEQEGYAYPIGKCKKRFYMFVPIYNANNTSWLVKYKLSVKMTFARFKELYKGRRYEDYIKKYG